MLGGGVRSQVRGGGYLVLGLGGGGTQSQVWGGTQSQVGGYSIPGPGGHPVPDPGGGGYPLSRPGMGYPLCQTWDEVPPPPARPAMGYLPPPPASVDRYTDRCQNITFPRTTYAGGNNVAHFGYLNSTLIPQITTTCWMNFSSFSSNLRRRTFWVRHQEDLFFPA